MIDNLEAKITFEIPNHLDFDKLIRGNNYTGFWQNLQHQQDVAARAAAMGSLGVPGAVVGGVAAGEAVFGDYNASDFNLLSSLQNFASRSAAGPAGLGDGGEQLLDPTYERFIGDVWVGIVLTLMILSSIFCMCSCFLYHKFRQWQRSVLTARSQTLSSMDVETPPPYDVESLPSYTIVSGLPSYNDAIEQLKQKQQQQQQKHAGYEPVKVHHHASVIKLFESQSQELMMGGGGGAKLEEIRYNFVNARSTSAATAAAAAVGGDSSPGTEVSSPATSSNTNTVTGTTVVAVPNSFKSPTFESDGTIVVGLKKFHISRYSVEDERSSGVNS